LLIPEDPGISRLQRLNTGDDPNCKTSKPASAKIKKVSSLEFLMENLLDRSSLKYLRKPHLIFSHSSGRLPWNSTVVNLRQTYQELLSIKNTFAVSHHS